MYIKKSVVPQSQSCTSYDKFYKVIIFPIGMVKKYSFDLFEAK